MKNQNRRQKEAVDELDVGSKNGKRTAGRRQPHKKTPSKYTIVRTPQDIENLENVRRILAVDHPGLSLKTDSEVYRILPGKYQNAVETIQDLGSQVQDLTAKLAELEDLRTSIRRILELTSEKVIE